MSTAGAMLFCAHQALLGTPQDPDLLELLAAHPIAGRTPNEEQAPADSVLLLDPCGPVLTPLRAPAPLPTEMPR